MKTRSRSDCHSCEAESYTRNHYFTGKLMVERDFTDEQRYFMEKIRLHHQRLHGTGVVCGLQVTAHQEPCESRYLLLQPGSAVDCCGKDILVPHEEVIDLLAFPDMQTLLEEAAAAEADPGATPPTHTLQICIRYKECPTEDIPVLYDECGCDDTQCAPNRILESYELGLILDPALDEEALHQPRLAWNNTINLAHSEHIYLHEATQRLYVLTADDAGILYQISTDNFSVEASFALERKGLTLTSNQDGTALYVVVAHEDGIAVDNDAELWVFDTTATQLATGPVATGVIPDSDNSLAQALSLTNDQLLVLLGDNNARLYLWNAGVAAPDTPDNQATLAVNLTGLAQGSDGRVYSAQPASSTIHAFDISAADFAPATLNGGFAAGDSVDAVKPVLSTGPDGLAVLDRTNSQLRLIDPASGGTFVAGVTLAHEPQDLIVTQGGQWAYVLLRDGDDSYLQSVNLHALHQGQGIIGTPVPVGEASTQLGLTASGRRLFVPYISDLDIANAGGVAVVDISERNCLDLLWPEDCPACETSDCVVLATIENYRPNFRLLDMTDPPADPLTDLNNGVARINNRLGRKRLPSTQAIVDALTCLMENCCGSGNGGEQGPPGDPGADGQDGEDASLDGVEVETIPCGEPASGEIVKTATGETIVRLRIPTNCEGVSIPELTHICNISWEHGGEVAFEEFVERGFFIRFDNYVRREDLHHHSVRMLLGRTEGEDPLMTYVELSSLPKVLADGSRREPFLDIIGLYFESPQCSLDGFSEAPDAEFVNGVWLRLSKEAREELSSQRGEKREDLQVRIQVVGDFIRDRNDLALDGNHLPAWVPKRPSGDGIQGGTFESYFTLINVPMGDGGKPDNPQNPDDPGRFDGNLVDINRASFAELTRVNGIGAAVANAIIQARSQSPIRSAADLQRIAGVGRSLASRISKQIHFDVDGE